LWSLFSGTPDRKRDHLFRVESQLNKQSSILLQSATEPESSEDAQVVATKKVTISLTEGAYYGFKLVAYPTKCLSGSKKIVEIKEPSQRVEWLQRKLDGANVQITSMDDFLVRSKKSFNARFVCYKGVLQVLNPSSIEASIIMGIGRKKHAGAGLLSLATVK
jgi:CRISPR system Cascade subunit CasE